MSAQRATGAVAAAVLAAICLGLPATASADPTLGAAVRAGTPGIGLDLDLGLSPSFGMRVGFSGFNINHNIDTSDVNYDGRLKLRTVTGLLDWYVMRGGFHLTAGVAGNDTKLDVVGRPTQDSFTIDGTTYSSAQLGIALHRRRLGESCRRGQPRPLSLRCRRHLRRHAERHSDRTVRTSRARGLAPVQSGAG